MSVRDLLPWRQAVAEARAYGIPGCTVHSETAAWPDPYGPDPVVFGPWPRVRGN